MYLWFLKDSCLLCTFCRAITYGDVNYDYIAQTFASCEEQRNSFAFDKEKEKYKKKSKSCCVKQGCTSITSQVIG